MATVCCGRGPWLHTPSLTHSFPHPSPTSNKCHLSQASCTAYQACDLPSWTTTFALLLCIGTEGDSGTEVNRKSIVIEMLPLNGWHDFHLVSGNEGCCQQSCRRHSAWKVYHFDTINKAVPGGPWKHPMNPKHHWAGVGVACFHYKQTSCIFLTAKPKANSKFSAWICTCMSWGLQA